MVIEYTFRVIIFNDFGEEQNLLFSELFNDRFSFRYRFTNVDILMKWLSINDSGVLITCDISREREIKEIDTILEGAHGVLIMCDISREREIKEIDTWLKNILSHRENLRWKIPIILVGYITNDKKSKIPSEELRNLAKSYKLDGYEICNLQTGENVEVIFENLARDCIKRYG